MASTPPRLTKAKCNLLIRNAVKVVTHLQTVLDDDTTPKHVKARLLACLGLLDRGLLGQPMKDERVVIEVKDGQARIIFASDYVKVVIRDRDSEFEE